MTMFTNINAAVIGTGFIGNVHVQALRRTGVGVKGVMGSSPERSREKAAEISVEKAYASLEDLLADDSIDVVHVTSPNHAHYSQVKAILGAGKHVICEKPLALNSSQSSELVELARAAKKVCAVCYNIRFYPLNQHARGMVQSGELGDIRFVTGHYHQDWLAKDTDWNWRLLANQGGALRSVGDIGTHWFDLTSFIIGLKAHSVMAELSTFLPERKKPIGSIETFSNANGVRETVKIDTDDASMIMIRYEGGARGLFSTSQINIGRKNALHWDIAGSASSASWSSETPDHLFIGHRERANETLMRDFTLMNDAGVKAAALPPGHVEGFADSFASFFRSVYSDVIAGGRRQDSNWATFEDGHYEMQFCDAVLKSARENRWVDLDEI